MEIPKYLEPEWVKRVKECNESRSCEGGVFGGIIFPRGTILKLKDPGSGAWPLNTVKEYTVVHDNYSLCKDGWGTPFPETDMQDYHSWFLVVRVDDDLPLDEAGGNFNLQVYYPVTEETRLLPTVRFYSRHDEIDEGVDQEIVFTKINTKWKLQLARMRLALAKYSNEKLGGDSFYDVPGDIIGCIGEKIEAAVGERPLIGDDGIVDRGGAFGGGYTFKYKKKRKSKKKRRKTKRKKHKTKRKEHKTKRRK